MVTPATEAPGMLLRKMPIIAAVPAWAGASALIAVPPCDAPQAVLNVSPPFGYAARRMLRQVSPMKRRLAGLQAQREDDPPGRDVADPLEDAGDPVPQVAEDPG